MVSDAEPAVGRFGTLSLSIVLSCGFRGERSVNDRQSRDAGPVLEPSAVAARARVLRERARDEGFPSIGLFLFEAVDESALRHTLEAIPRDLDEVLSEVVVMDHSAPP